MSETTHIKTTPSESYIKEFTDQYFATLLWAEGDEEADPKGGEFFDQNYGVEDIDAATVESHKAECVHFVHLAWEDIEDLKASTAGHDFWLTRQGHGAGFWDGGYEEEVGERLTELSKRFGSGDCVIGDDGTIYCE